MTTRLPVAALLAALPVVFSCRLEPEEFHSRLFSCNPSAADPGCGADRAGEPMVCVAAHQLGGPNFCSESCDSAAGSPGGDAICLAAGPPDAGRLSGARLRSCAPESGDGACGHPELSCLRTDLIADEGVCMTLTPCATSSDCRDPVRSTCMGELLRDNYGEKAGLKADHTYCVQQGCHATGASCSPGESCLRKLIPRESRPSDICVPNCDANRNCPPNYFCYPDLYSRIAPAICIPGLMGLRCRTSMDCLFGDCVDTGAGYNVCTVKCQDDSDCSRYNSEHGVFFCNDQKWCAGPRAFQGGLCEVTEDCRPGEICARPSPDMRTGACLFPCDANGQCPSYGGVGHACLPQRGNPNGPPICVGGRLEIPCQADGNCIKGLQCREVPTTPLKICTILCKADSDCKREPFAQEGWCHAELGLCRAPLKDDAPCERDEQCESHKCITDPAQAGKKKCDKTPGY